MQHVWHSAMAPSVSPMDSASSVVISEMLFILILQQRFVIGWTQLNTANQYLMKEGIKRDHGVPVLVAVVGKWSLSQEKLCQVIV